MGKINLEKWQEDQKKMQTGESENLPLLEEFIGRKEELAQLKKFIEKESKKVFFLYGVPMIGKSTLVREFAKSIPNYRQLTIKFTNPESPATTIDKSLDKLQNIEEGEKLFIVIENFEEALQGRGNIENLHEIKFQKVEDFIKYIGTQPNAKLLIESRFQINNNFLHPRVVAELPTKQLAKIDRAELFHTLNKNYRQGNASWEDFEQLCEAFDEHIWLISLAMQDNHRYEHLLEAKQNPKSLTQKLWKIIQQIIRNFLPHQRTLLCAFGILNPIPKADIYANLKTIPKFEKKEAIDEALLSLRKKLLLMYDANQEYFEINPFLREVCFSYLQDQKEMKAIKQLPFFQKAALPKYNHLIQTFEKGYYADFFRELKDMRKKKKYNEVIDILHEVYSLSSKPAIILNELGVTYKWQKNYSKAISTLERGLTFEPSNVKLLNELAIVYKAQGDYPNAISTLERGLTFEPSNVKLLNELGIVYKEQKEYLKAISTLERGLKFEPSNVKLLNELAIVYKEQKEYSKAISTLEQAIALGNLPSYNELAIVYKAQGDYPNAISTLERGLKFEPSNVKLLNELAIVYKEQKEYSNAISTLERGLKFEPRNVKLLNELAIVYKAQGDYPNAISTLERGLTFEPRNVKLLNELAIVYKAQGDYPKAISTLEQAIALGHVPSYNELGIVYKEQKKYLKAISTLERGLKINDKDVKLLNELAIVYKAQGDYPNAISTLERGLTFEPRNVKLLNELAIVYKAQGKYKEARALIDKGLSQQPNDQFFKSTRAAIDRAEAEAAANQFKSTMENLKQMIAKGQLAQAIEQLLTLLKEREDLKPFEQECVHLSSRYNQLEKNTRLGILSNSEETTTRNQLVDSFLKLLEQIENNPQNAFANGKTNIVNSKNTLVDTNIKSGGNVIIGDGNVIANNNPHREPNPPQEKQKILFIAANPSNETRIQTGVEHRTIKAEMQRGTHRDGFEFLQPQLAATITELLRALKQKPQIIHFAGHGNEKGIIICNDNNESKPLNLDIMQRLFNPLKGITKIILLNSCYSAEQAKSISEYGMYVIGNNLPIGDNAAISFSKGLYNGLSEGASFESAFNDAMAVVLTESREYANVIEVWKDGEKLDL